MQLAFKFRIFGASITNHNKTINNESVFQSLS